ncbi:MAG: hypothetical protein U9R19_06680 [Bacteroidota bacterium]|nr:hypothetical protein [Bacteroidota bacterium]
MKKINSVATTTYQKNGDELIEPYKSSYLEYNKNGNITCVAQYMPDGEVESKTISEYDENNRLIRQSEYFSEDEISEKAEYIRDEKGVLLEIKKNYADGSESTLSYRRSENTLTITTNDEDGELDEKEVVVFDANENIILKEIYDYNNKLQEKYENEFDEKGHLVKQTEFTSGGMFSLTSELKYDDEGRVLSQVSYNNKKELTHKLIFKYDDKGRVVEQHVSNAYVMKTEYDDENHSQFETRTNIQGMVDIEKFSQFDEHGNILEEQEGFIVTKYEYKYFKDKTEH